MVTLPAISESKQVILLNLPAFAKMSDEQVKAAARRVPGGHKVSLTDRATAIAVVVGTRDLNDPTLYV